MATLVPKNSFVEKTIEFAAVISSLLYTYLYIQGNVICWLFAFIGAVLFTWLCYRKNILAEAFLQVFYVVMAVYGYINKEDQWILGSYAVSTHVVFLIISTIAWFLCYKGLQKWTKSALPGVDAFTTVFSITATWLMVNYIHENYLYWIIIDAVAIFLYAHRKMYFAAALFFLYLLLVIEGYFELGILA